MRFLTAAGPALVVRAEHDVGLATLATGDAGLVPSFMKKLGFERIGASGEDVIWRKPQH